MRFAIKGKQYDFKQVESLSIRQAIEFNAATASIGAPMTWADVEDIQREISALKTAEEKGRHPGTILILALVIWASRLVDEPDTRFLDVLDISLNDITFIPEPSDHKVSDKPDPRSTRPGSGRGSNDAARKRSKSTSKRASTSE